LPQKPRAVFLRRFADSIVALKPDNAPGQHDRRIGCEQVEMRQLRNLRRQKVERFVLSVAAIDNVGGLDPRAARSPQRFGHAAIATGGPQTVSPCNSTCSAKPWVTTQCGVG
jgi:hypothetical protein